MKYKSYKNNKSGAVAPANVGKHLKLTEEEVQEIIYLYCEKGVTQKVIADHYGISRRTIQYILNPESRRKNYERVMQEDKEQHRERMRNFRLKNKGGQDNGKHRED